MKKVVLSLMFSLLPGIAFAEDINAEVISVEPVQIEEINTEQKGFEVMQEMDKRDMGWGDMSTSMQMVLKNKNGDEHVRNLKMTTLEMQDDGDKSLSIFDSPRDIKGTAFLSFTHALDADEQWLYLPALKRVKRISSSNKSGPFLGSEFAFEDLTSFELKKYKYNYLREEVVDGIDSFVIETYPQYKHSGYTRNIVWVDKERYIPIKIDYYDRKDALLKTQTFNDYQQYLDQYWRANNSYMENHLTGKSTTLVWENYTFRNGLTERNFDKNTLKRSR
ncbi:outer membrane lipoprotein-sorting protein [Methyloprofundus sp.]|uniref:outer membrane lipoprotein-sorting protein n=1 Tax=Methyloprofundus sp. TaxID=2020875 RepID=UPI003D0BDB69